MKSTDIFQIREVDSQWSASGTTSSVYCGESCLLQRSWRSEVPQFRESWANRIWTSLSKCREVDSKEHAIFLIAHLNGMTGNIPITDFRGTVCPRPSG